MLPIAQNSVPRYPARRCVAERPRSHKGTAFSPEERRQHGWKVFAAIGEDIAGKSSASWDTGGEAERSRTLCLSHCPLGPK